MTHKKYTAVDDLNAIGWLIKDFREKEHGYLVDILSTTDGASTQSPEDRPESIGIVSLDDPAVGIYCKGLGGDSATRILPHRHRSNPWITVMGREEDVERFEKLMQGYRT